MGYEHCTCHQVEPNVRNIENSMARQAGGIVFRRGCSRMRRAEAPSTISEPTSEPRNDLRTILAVSSRTLEKQIQLQAERSWRLRTDPLTVSRRSNVFAFSDGELSQEIVSRACARPHTRALTRALYELVREKGCS